MATPTLFFTLFSLSAIYIATAETQSFNLQSNSSCLPSPSSQFALSVGRRIIATANVTFTWTANRDDKPIASGEILLSNYANSKITWWSFDFPTNKIVSVQRLDNDIMTLHFCENNHSIGRFQIIIKDDESAVLHRTVNINTSVDFYWSLRTSMRGRNISLKLDDDGNLHLNNSAGFNRSNQSAAGKWSGIVNICQNKIEVDKVSQSNSTDRAKKTQASKNVLVVGIVLIITSIAILLAGSGYLISRRRILMHVKNPVHSSAPTFIEEMNLRRFSYGELVKFTENFKEEVGRGSFGKVYKGLLPNGDKRNIAVKKLELIGEEREREFEAEMKTIGRTHHRNLVRLMGFCNQGSNRLLVYEFMSNGSLADLLFKAKTCLDWSKRMKIALDVAKGIYYLHEECDTHIIHCDIKPQNILMDKGGTAKISDFGLAKLLLSDQTKTSTGIRGTRGYVAPEWFKRAPITMKVDVFSFGIVLLELACSRRHVEIEAAENEIVLLDWVYDCHQRGELHKLAPAQEIEKATMERMVRVGLCCTIDDPASRPTMKEVILMLEGIVNTPTPPSPFSSYTHSKNHTLQN